VAADAGRAYDHLVLSVSRIGTTDRVTLFSAWFLCSRLRRRQLLRRHEA
jgi:hypothetical protein